eukprot:760341-Hanusia_phi.AAC.2
MVMAPPPSAFLSPCAITPPASFVPPCGTCASQTRVDAVAAWRRRTSRDFVLRDAPPATMVRMTRGQDGDVSELSSALKRLDRKNLQVDPLAGTRWLLKLDFGREPGTWMDARWGASGQRVKVAVAVEMLKDGSVRPIDYQYGLFKTLTSPQGSSFKVKGSFPNEVLEFSIKHSGLPESKTGCDVSLPEGDIFFSIGTLGTKLGSRGRMSIEQYRFFVRRERRIVGTFAAERIE